MTNAEADALIATLPKPRGLRLVREGSSILMAGGKTGSHSIAVGPSSAERLLVHWQGYVENQGLSLGPGYSPAIRTIPSRTARTTSKPKSKRAPSSPSVQQPSKPWQVANVAKFEALLQHHRETAAMWKEEAALWKADPTAKEAADEERRARAFAKEHDQFIVKLLKAAQSNPWKLVELTADARKLLTPEDLQLTEEDVFGKDEDA